MTASYDYRELLISSVRNLTMEEAERVYHFVLCLTAQSADTDEGSGFRNDCLNEVEMAGQWTPIGSLLAA